MQEVKKQMNPKLLEDIKRNTDSALKEDKPFSDITTPPCLEKKSGVAALLLKKEGTHLKPEAVARIKGSMHSLLAAAERTRINFIQPIISSASNTAQSVHLDTHKAMSGSRYLQKYAAQIGGGKNHRLHLADQILIKDNHLACHTIGGAIEKARQKYSDKRVEVETLEIFEEALKHQPTAILFDNLSPGEISKTAQQN
jgi:nicotinate-nucleotide pyrophosphorylase (carboxylating)